MKGVIIYKGKYGATRQYAEWLSQERQLPVMTPEAVTQDILMRSDFIVLGSSVYIGKLLLGDWLKTHVTILKDKKVFLFIVCGTSQGDGEKIKKITKDNIPAEITDTCSVYILPGRRIFKNLSWMDRFMVKVGALMTKDPVIKQAMLHDIDGVKKENMAALISALEAFTPAEIKAEEFTEEEYSIA